MMNSSAKKFQEECHLKNILRTSAMALITAGLVAGCSTPAPKPLVDGTYSVMFDQPDSTNWKAFMTIEIADGRITDVNYDYEGTGDNEGKLKSEDAAYNEAMFATKGTKPTIYLDELEKSLLEHQDPDKVDTVSGATTSSKDFRTFVKAVLESAREGKKDPIIISQYE
ncbi:MAG TPA: hypothetical protein DHM90_01935 [Clostridiaceae bacterium]|nr:hypothetical protein [Clostridiaceae bacterium]